MNLPEASQNVLRQLYQVIENIDNDSFTRPLLTLNNSTIGQHVRHTLEFYICLFEGIETGVVNYDMRRRDQKIETDYLFALSTIEGLINQLDSLPMNLNLQLQGSYSEQNDEEQFIIDSNVQRELAYNIEHAVHHMAIIKIGLTETNPALEIPANFGVAVSTVRYNN